MSELQSKNFDQPDELISLPNLTGQVVLVGQTYVGRYVHKPGWRWSKDIQPLRGTSSCQFHHQGTVVSGQLHVVPDQGSAKDFGPGDVFDVPPGHDAWVVGDEPCITIDFLGVREWARPVEAGDRLLATLLFTDLVGSTAMASKVGDSAWADALDKHYQRVRVQLGQFRGLEITTTGDGVLALFDGTARAIRCAAAVSESTRQDGMQVRVGVHTGEVERYSGGVQGVAVHVAQRIMSLSGPGEVWVSDSTVALLEGSGLKFGEAGEHELKGLSGRRKLYRLTALQA
jgi:class 3 adenylate cyclase